MDLRIGFRSYKFSAIEIFSFLTWRCALIELIRSILKKLKLRKYDEFNRAEYFRSQGAKIGKNCRILIHYLASEPWLVEVGDRVAISTGVSFITHDGGVHVFRQEIPELQNFGRIKIGNNCAIGINVILLPGVTIGDNCVIGAGSVVTREIPSNSFAFGVPARVLMPIEKYKERFLEEWKIQKPPGYGESIDLSRKDNVEYLVKQHIKEMHKFKEHFEKIGLI